MTDYAGAIDFPAHPSNTLGPPNHPKGFVLHTPEEEADDYPGTPYYFAQPNREASTTYFVSYLGFVYQCVSESVAAIANGVLGKPYPAWANSNISLNRQTISVEIEGYAATIAQTISPAQKTALLNLIRDRCNAHGIPIDRQHIIGHYEVASNRTDPGTLSIDAIVAELQQGNEEDDVKLQFWQVHNPGPNDPIFVTDGLSKIGVATNEYRTDLVNTGLAEDKVYSVERVTIDSLFDLYAAHANGTGAHNHDT